MKTNKEYFEWLCNMVEHYDEKGTHDILFRKLMDTEFYALIDDDNNRAADGRELRNEFFGYEENPIESACSWMELLIGLARRMNFAYSQPDENYFYDMFWLLLDNIGIKWTDMEYVEKGGDLAVSEALTRVCDRTYGEDGSGGLFPMKYPRQNQRYVPMWYQMQRYIREMLMIECRL